MKLKKEFITHDTGSESLLVPAGGADFSGLFKGNKTLGAILSLLKEDTTEEAVIDAMKEQFDAPEDIIERDVKKVVSELRKIGALEESECNDISEEELAEAKKKEKMEQEIISTAIDGVLTFFQVW